MNDRQDKSGDYGPKTMDKGRKIVPHQLRTLPSMGLLLAFHYNNGRYRKHSIEWILYVVCKYSLFDQVGSNAILGFYSYGRAFAERVNFFEMKTLALLFLVALAMRVVVSTSASGQLSIPAFSLASLGLNWQSYIADAWWNNRRRRAWNVPWRRNGKR